MNDKITISTAQLFAMFPDEGAARSYLESRRWPNGPRCPVCDSGERIGIHSAGHYRCYACREAFSVRTGTVMERSHVPLHKWMRALIMVAVEGVLPTGAALSKATGIQQPTTCRMLKRLKQALDLRGS